MHSVADLTIDVTSFNFPSISTVCALLAVYVTLSRITAFSSCVLIIRAYRGVLRNPGHTAPVNFCRMCEVTVLRRKQQRCLRSSCFRPTHFRSSCHRGTIIVPAVLCAFYDIIVQGDSHSIFRLCITSDTLDVSSYLQSLLVLASILLINSYYFTDK